MHRMRAQSKSYSVVILKSGPKYEDAIAPTIIREHGRRNFELRQQGALAIVCPVADGSDIKGVGIFATDLQETTRIMDGDPGVRAGIFLYEVHSCRSFPGDALP